MRSDLNIKGIAGSLRRTSPMLDFGRSMLEQRAPKISRRTFLVTSAAAAVAQLPALATFHRLAGRMRIVHLAGRISFQIDNRDIFIIDPQYFSGNPRIHFAKNGDGYVAQLEQAYFPGTDLRADLLVDIWQGIAGWKFKLLFDQLGIALSGNLEEFLLGKSAEQEITSPDYRVDSGDPVRATVVGPSMASFHNDWRLVFSKSRMSRLEVHSSELLGDELALQIPMSGTSILLLRPAKRRTILELRRGAHTWDLLPQFEKSSYRLSVQEQPFDVISLEVEENSRGRVRMASLAEGFSERSTATATPRDPGKLAPGMRLALRKLKYAQSHQDGSEYFQAHLAETAKWLPLGGLNIGLSNKPVGPSFALQSNQEGCTENVDPSLSLSPNLPGALVVTTKVPDSVSVPLTFGKFWCEVKSFLHFDTEHRRVCLKHDPLIIKILRPRDLLNLVLEFHCMEFHCHHGDSFFTVARDKSPEDVRVVVYFPRQSMAEECFPLGDQSCNPGNPDLTKKRPVKTRLTQRSRLVFQPLLKGDDHRLPLRMESLLDWSGWKLKVPTLAKPPIDIEGKFACDGRIESDFICDFTDATIKNVDAGQKIVTVDQPCEKRFKRFEVPKNPPDVPNSIIVAVDELLTPTRLKVSDVTGLKVGQHCIVSVPCKPLPLEERPTDKPSLPKPLETAIELPYRLVISPNEFGQFRNSRLRNANNSAGSELWHSSLMTGIEEPEIATNQSGGSCKHSKSQRLQTIRAVWSPDIGADPGTQIPFEQEAPFAPHFLPMTASQRGGIVNAFTNYQLKNLDDSLFNPVSMPVKTLALSALGGWIDGAVSWEPPLGTDLSSWQQRTAEGRDNLVKLEFKGFLLPTGHRVTLLLITQREWCKDPKEALVAMLVKRCQILIPRPLKTYAAIGQKNGSRDFPFRSARITIPRTPFLDPNQCTVDQETLWPQVCGADFRFPLELIDLEGRTIKTDLPMMFVRNSVVFPETQQTRSKSVGVYLATLTLGRKTSLIGQQKIAYAEPGKPGDTAFTTTKLLWSVSDPSSDSSALRQRFDQPPWYPNMEQATIQLNSVQVFSGKDGGTDVSIASPYIEKGFPKSGKGDNEGEVFLKVAGSQPKLDFPGEKGGGIVLPSTALGAVSRKMGPVGGTPDNAVTLAAKGSFDSGLQFTGFPKITLLGAIDLAEVIVSIIGFSGQAQKVPKLIQQEIRDVRQQIDSVKAAIQTAILDPLSLPIPGSTPPISFRAALKQYQTAAKQQADALVLATESTIISQIVAVLGDSQALTNLQKNASDSLKDADLTSLPRLREYFVQQIKGTVTQDEINSLRKEFDAVGQREVRAIQGALAPAKAKLESVVGSALTDSLDALQNELNAQNIDLQRVADLITALKAGFDEVLAVASAVEAMQKQFETVRNSVLDQIKSARTTVQTSMTNLKTEADNAKWNLETTANQAIKRQLAALQQDIDDKLDTLAKWPTSAAAALQTYIDQNLKAVQDALDKALHEALDQLLQGVLAILQLPTAITVSYQFEPQLQDAPKDNPIFKASRGDATCKLVIDSAVTKSLVSSKPVESRIQVKLTDFELHLFPFAPFIVLPFSELSALTENGGSPQVKANIKLDEIKFLGPLDFVKQLQTLLSFDGFSIRISPADIQALLAVNLPDLSIGAFNLEHVSFNAELLLSFLGEPVKFRFAFAERNRPFLLSFGIFGGGGFVALELRSKSNIIKVEAALEFGAVAELNFGVAHGGVHIFGGFYFLTEPDHLILRGYLRAGGELSVLDIISVSLEFTLALAYENRSGTAVLVGECTLTVEVHVLFFSASVRLSLRREFTNGGSQQSELVGPRRLPRFARALYGDDETGLLGTNFISGGGRNWVESYRKHYESYAW